MKQKIEQDCLKESKKVYIDIIEELKSQEAKLQSKVEEIEMEIEKAKLQEDKIFNQYNEKMSKDNMIFLFENLKNHQYFKEFQSISQDETNEKLEKQKNNNFSDLKIAFDSILSKNKTFSAQNNLLLNYKEKGDNIPTMQKLEKEFEEYLISLVNDPKLNVNQIIQYNENEKKKGAEISEINDNSMFYINHNTKKFNGV